MSQAGHRRPARPRPALSPHRHRTRAFAALSALAFGAAGALPVAAGFGGTPARVHDASSRVHGESAKVHGESARVHGAFATVQGASATVHGSTATVRGASVRAADQIRAREWHLGVLRVEKAWRYSRGRGVTVAVLDTGVDGRHPDLTGQVLTGPDLTGGVRRPGTRYWGLHGTSMASIIAGHGHGPGASRGMLGVAPQSRVLSVRVTLENDDPLRRDNGQQTGGDRDAIAQGIRYAVDHGADIVNMSLGGGRQFYNGTASQEAAIKYALRKGVVLIASAGNDGSGANRKNFPAAYAGVIAVGALDRQLRLWKDSNRHSHAAVCAPGVDIVSADASDGYVVGTGTSASSAMVAGVAALVRSRYPELRPEQVRQALIAGSPPRPGHPTGSPTCGGTVDAVRALVAAQGISKTVGGPVESPPPPPPVPAARASGGGSSLLLPLVIGGVLLVVAGIVLALRQRGRTEEDAADTDTDAVADYGLPSAPPMPREPEPFETAGPFEAAAPFEVAAPFESAEPFETVESVAPVNVPLWQGAETLPRPPLPDVPPADPSPVDAPPIDPVDGSWGAPFPAESAPEPSPEQPLFGSSELRPFVPDEYVDDGWNRRHDDHLNGLNGSVWEDDAEPRAPSDPQAPSDIPEPDDEPKGWNPQGFDDEEHWW
ncbi:hypothetical protein GCM10022254_39490 [Actinomadura meridiana]|uniref:Peptidase S8/S53 domain-containing protein n=1 Tax=Actinomadura meridiana TaxID=559626 RepID=A0ABP8C6D0_9ACTN